MLPGLYGAFAGNTFDGHKYDDGFGYRMRNSVVGTRTRYWHDYLQVIMCVGWLDDLWSGRAQQTRTIQ